MQDLTKRQIDILKYINQTIQKQGFPPTLREICKKFQIASTNGARYHLYRLKEMGYLQVEPNKSRGVRIVETAPYLPTETAAVAIPILGQVPAGPFNLASAEGREEEMMVDTRFFGVGRGRQGVFGLRVKGDSMIDAGICDGDLVIVRPEAEVRNGDIVVARLGDEATVKRYEQTKDVILLKPENRQYQPIRIPRQGKHEEEPDFAILGLVVGLMRSIH